MDLDQLRTFLAVLEHGNFSRAAQALRLTQSTVSFHVKALETELGARLVDRVGGRPSSGSTAIRPTAAGRVLRRYAGRLLALRDEAVARVAGEEHAHAGRVQIAASTIPAEYVLPGRLRDFQRGHPNVS